MRPLIVVMDDAQWADAASLAAVPSTLSHPDRRNVMVILTFAEAEVPQTHSLWQDLGALAPGINPVTIPLEPLALPDVAELLIDATHRDPIEVMPLAALVLEKTAGNPFFIDQFLHSLHDAGCLWQLPDQRQWAWDLKSIEAAPVTANVGRLMATRLGALPAPCRELLRTASYLGNRFSIRLLAQVHGCSPAEARSEARGRASRRLGSMSCS
ncbi:MAG: ATP-binding protein [Candidatus Xenobia bacterium]